MHITDRYITLDKFIVERFVPFTEPPFGGALLQEGDFIEKGMKRCVALDISGALVYPECQELVVCIKRLIEKGERMIVLNLQSMTKIDESGVGCLVSCYLNILSSAGALLLANPTHNFQDYIKSMRFL